MRETGLQSMYGTPRRSSLHAYGSISRHSTFADDHKRCPVERMSEARIFMLHHQGHHGPA